MASPGNMPPPPGSSGPGSSAPSSWWDQFRGRYFSGNGRDIYTQVARSQPQGTVGYGIGRIMNVLGLDSAPAIIRNAGSRGLGQFALNEPLMSAEGNDENIEQFAEHETNFFAQSPQMTQRILGRALSQQDRVRLIRTAVHGSTEEIVDELHQTSTRYVNEHTPPDQ
jgi:hypothetical protein